MSTYPSQSRIFDINANKRHDNSKPVFTFDHAYLNSNNNNSNDHRPYNRHKQSNSSNSIPDINHNHNFRNRADTGSSNSYDNKDDNDTFYDASNKLHNDNTAHNTSGYSSGFDDATSYGSNSTLHETSFDDHRQNHLQPPYDYHQSHPHHQHRTETTHEVEYSRAPDTFPCGHILCHKCIRKFMRMRQRSGYSCCPVCHAPIYEEDISLSALGLAVNHASTTSSVASTPSPSPFPSRCTSPTPSYNHSPFSPPPSSPSPYYTGPTSPNSIPTSPAVFGPPPESPSPSDPTPISLLTNFTEMVKKFTGFENGHFGLRRLKDESVKSKSMGMTYTNTQCHLCHENHGTLRVVQEYNKLAVKHERPNLWSNYFYRLQHGKIVTEFHTKVNSSCICVPCTFRELQARNLPQLKALPDVDPNIDTDICLAEVGKILAKNSAPIMALQGKNVIEIEHTLQLRQRADQFDFQETADQVEKLVKQQEEMLLNIATRQIRDTGRLYHIQESNSAEYDLDETEV